MDAPATPVGDLADLLHVEWTMCPGQQAWLAVVPAGWVEEPASIQAEVARCRLTV
jgi:hypothetical protein